MAALLARIAAAIGLPGRLGRVLLILLMTLLLIGGLWLVVVRHDRALIARHEAAGAAVQAQADRAADAVAATRRRDDDARLEAEADALERTTTDATDTLAARRAYYDCIRLQQQARAAGRLTPACR